jgi:F0F1-type ATP synthase beta subunit
MVSQVDGVPAAPVAGTGAPTGRVAGAHGVVLDVDVGQGPLPAIRHALAVERLPRPPLVVEVQAHVGPRTVRCLSLSTPGGSAAAWASARSVGRS